MGQYQIFDVIKGIVTSRKELESFPSQDWSRTGKLWSPCVLVMEYEPGGRSLPVWFSYVLYDNSWDKLVIGAGKGALGLFETVNRVVMPGIRKLSFPPDEEIVSFLKMLGFSDPELELYAVSEW